MGESLHNDDTIYIAVSQDVGESEKTLLWTLRNFQGKKLFLLLVHLPFSLTPSSSWLKESEVDAIQESLLKDSYASLLKYRDICVKKGVNAKDVDTWLISGHDVGEEIVKVICQHKIKKLIMGAAADAHYSRGMLVTSRKAEYVSEHAPNSCKIWLICKGNLIKTSYGLGNPSSSSFTDVTGYEKVKPKGRKEEEAEPPQDYICPITMEIMREPHVAADGFTYEGEAFREWLREGGRISPKTGERLKDKSLTPNFTLRALINDWLHQHPTYVP